MDIGQNDLHSTLGSMTEKQVLELIPNITALFARAVEVNITLVLTNHCDMHEYIQQISEVFSRFNFVHERVYVTSVCPLMNSVSCQNAN